MQYQLRDLEYFAAIAEHGQVQRAAAALGLSQPALSKSILRLEQSMQAKLLKRTPKGVELTSEGSALLAHIRKVRLSLDDAAREITDLGQGRAGLLRIGANARLAVDLMPAACAVLLNEATRLTLDVTLREGDSGMPALLRGELDLYVTATHQTDCEGLAQEELSKEERVIFASAHHRLARKKRVTLADIAQERWLLGVDTPALLRRAFAKSGLPPPQVAAIVNSVLLRRQILPLTDLLTFGPRQFFREGASRSRVVELPVTGLSSPRSVSVCYRKDAYISPAARRFIEILKSTAKKIAAE